MNINIIRVKEITGSFSQRIATRTLICIHFLSTLWKYQCTVSIENVTNVCQDILSIYSPDTFVYNKKGTSKFYESFFL